VLKTACAIFVFISLILLLPQGNRVHRNRAERWMVIFLSTVNRNNYC
jgi:hypothetical protein